MIIYLGALIHNKLKFTLISIAYSTGVVERIIIWNESIYQ